MDNGSWVKFMTLDIRNKLIIFLFLKWPKHKYHILIVWELRAINIKKDRVAPERVVIRYRLPDINFLITLLIPISILLRMIMSI